MEMELAQTTDYAKELVKVSPSKAYMKKVVAYGDYQIDGIDDKEGYKKLREARLENKT